MDPLHIKHIGDLPTAVPNNTMLVDSDRDYCHACDLILGEPVDGPATVWVRGQHHFTWLQNFVNHVSGSGLRPVVFSIATPRDALAQTTQLPLPEWLTTELILAGELLETGLPPGIWSSVELALLDGLMGNPGEAFPQGQAGVMAERAAAPAVVEALAANELRLIAWQQLVQRWAKQAGQEAWVAAYCERLMKDPARLWRDLTVWRLLCGYPGQWQEFAMEPASVGFVRKVPLVALTGMPLQPEGKRLALEQVTLFFHQATAAQCTRERFLEWVAMTSGELRAEFDALSSLLGRGTFAVKTAEVEAVVRRFSGCGELNARDFARLRLHVRPAVPALPDLATVDAKGWATWFHDEYLPYRWWQTERGQADSEVEAVVGKFSGWYCSEFAQVHSDPELSAVHLLSKWRESILGDSVSLILMVDNLPWFFWDDFERALSAAGLHRHESGDCFVPLPSLTSYSKPAIVAGHWEAAGTDYAKMLEERSAAEWAGRAVQYLNGADQLAEVTLSAEPRVVFLNYLAGDTTLHSDAAAAGTHHAAQLSQLYQGLGMLVGDFARRASTEERKFGLYVFTDHGACMILDAERQAVDAQLSKKLFPNEKYRSASFGSDEAIPENLWALGHRFTSPLAADGRVHFIPRGHNTVASQGKGRTYAHGGASPEEVIVPCGVFRRQRIVWSPPGLRFVNLTMHGNNAAFYIQRISNVEVEIQNPNSAECHLTGVSLSPEAGEVRDFGAITIQPKSTRSTTVSLYFSASAKNVSLLRFDLSFRIANDSLTRGIEQPVVISSAMRGGVDLNNLLT